MKNHILKTVAIICCLALCAGILLSCKSKEAEENLYPSDNPEDYPATISIPAQEADENGEISFSYSIPENVRTGYDKFAVKIYHDDRNNNLLATAEINGSGQNGTVAAAYGKIKLYIVGTKGDGQEEIIAVNKTTVWADEYNFASLNGTFPVVYFTLGLFSMDGESKANFEAANVEAGKNIQFIKNVPTFASLERVAAYNWNSLPKNVHTLPNVSYDYSISGDFHGTNNAMADYIAELYEINPESKFHFYCVDNYPELIAKFFYAQGIGDDSFDATFISDGTATVAAFKRIFSESDADEKYETLAAEWQAVKEKAAAGQQNYFEGLTHGYEDYSILMDYAFVMANEQSNIKWWISRDLFTANSGTQEIADKIALMKSNDEGGDKIEIFGINDMLSNLSAADQVNLKELFHFDGEMFSAAEENGKKILVIIGTSTAGEENIEQYLDLIKTLYGDEYQIYYKGHPGYLTGLNAQKLAMFEKYGITDIDGSIAAELILFYCPDVYLAGWSSTTYKSASTDRLLALFNETAETGLEKAQTDGYSDIPDSFYSFDAESGYVKIEYANGSPAKYYNATTNTIVDQLP